MKGMWGTVIVVAVVLFGVVSCERWKYNECRNVGHSWSYCAWKFLSQ